MKKKRILGLILAGVMLLSACAAAPPPAVQAPGAPGTAAPPPAQTPGVTVQAPAAQAGPTGSLTIAAMNETPALAPARHNHLQAIPKNFMTHERLFEQHYDTLEPLPLLVREWTALSDTLFEFVLHDNIIFHNGERLTAADVVASWHWVRETPDARGVHISAESIEFIDTYTFRIDTGVPDAGLFYDLTSHGNSVLPRSLIEAGHDFNALPVGSGQFELVEWRSGDFLEFRAFHDYWNPGRAARIDSITWRIIPEGASRMIAYEMGEVDFILDVPFPDIPRLEADANTTLFRRTSPALQFVNLNHQAHPFNNYYARRAISMAVNQEEIVAGAFDGVGIPTRALLPTVFAGATYEGAAPFDPEGALELLANNGIDPASIGFELTAGTEPGVRAAQIIQAQLGEIGIPVTVTQVESGVLTDMIFRADYEAAFSSWNAAWIISYLRNQLLHTDTMFNRNHLEHPEISALILEGIATIDPAARAAVFEQVSILANEYSVWIPSHLTETLRAFNRNLVAPEISGMTTILNLHTMFWND